MLIVISNWSDMEVINLIQLGEEGIQQQWLEGEKRNKPVYEKLYQESYKTQTVTRYRYIAEQCITKMKT